MKVDLAQLAITRQALQLQIAKLAENAHMAAMWALADATPEDGTPSLQDPVSPLDNKLANSKLATSTSEETQQINLPSPHMARCILANSLRGNTRELAQYLELQGHRDEPNDGVVDSEEDDGSDADDSEEQFSTTDWWNPGSSYDDDGYAPDCPCD
mgnify:FL=1